MIAEHVEDSARSPARKRHGSENEEMVRSCYEYVRKLFEDHGFPRALVVDPCCIPITPMWRALSTLGFRANSHKLRADRLS